MLVVETLLVIGRSFDDYRSTLNWHDLLYFEPKTNYFETRGLTTAQLRITQDGELPEILQILLHSSCNFALRNTIIELFTIAAKCTRFISFIYQ